ncbi:choice-of-anchor I domain-containing protein [Desulfosediminicola ganghwensis]|uniref:choice-of-anchor I domain-containing protein n=1 Tax=Desulfosediminicola ganghwensis TaxID=2569540 RepID=UPI0010AD39F7|nr:hypothetical protein [Desulfosediminicola ganghwensis]
MKKTIVRGAIALGLVCFAGLGTSCKKDVDTTALEINNPNFGGGKVLLYTTGGEFKGAAHVGNLPDMVAFLPSGDGLIVANEGEPKDDYSVDPIGSISIITLNPRLDGLVQDVTTLNFDGVAIPWDVRIKPGATPIADLEPEYVAVNEDGTKAWVTLQENNAIAVVDLEAKEIVAVKSLGKKSFDKVDIDTKDGANVVAPPANVYALYQPDTIKSYRVDGVDYIVTANEGDDREYAGWEDYEKAYKLTGKAKVSEQLTQDVLAQKGKKKLRVLKDMGMDGTGTYTEFYLAGGRSFSIWDAEGNQVYDSGSEFERYLAKNFADNFNTRVDDTKDPEDIAELIKDGVPFEMVGEIVYFWEGVDARSQKKGAEPEALALAAIGSRTFAYIGLEKQGGFFIYDISNPKQPVMINYINEIDFESLPSESGDLAPEGMVTFVQNQKHYLAIANELSGTVAIYQLAADGDATRLASLGIGTFGEGAAEILDYDPKSQQLFVTNGEKKSVDIINVAQPEAPELVGSIDFSTHADSLQSVAVKNGLVAIAVE